MNNNLKPITTLPPFKRLCMTIGELPTSYLETMTYYEMLVWFTEYIKNTIIPTINNNGLAIKELQDKYIELKTYVDNYFDNLDIQEEINNKLDEMAEGGQLTDIIAQYLGLAGVLAFNTVNDMKNATNLVNGSTCKTLGYYNINDGGNGLYKIRNITNQDVVNNMDIIPLNNTNLIAELISNERLNILQFGAKGDNSSDNTDIFKRAISYCLSKRIDLYIPKGRYHIYDTLEIKNYSINIYGENQNNSVLYIKENVDLFNIKYGYVNIKDLGFNAPTDYSASIINYNNSVNIFSSRIEKCNFSGSLTGTAIKIIPSNNVNIQNSSIIECFFYNLENAIYIDTQNGYYNGNIIKDCWVTGCKYGIYYNPLSTYGTSNLVISNFKGQYQANKSIALIYGLAGSNNSVSDCLLWDGGKTLNISPNAKYTYVKNIGDMGLTKFEDFGYRTFIDGSDVRIPGGQYYKFEDNFYGKELSNIWTIDKSSSATISTDVTTPGASGLQRPSIKLSTGNITNNYVKLTLDNFGLLDTKRWTMKFDLAISSLENILVNVGAYTDTSSLYANLISYDSRINNKLRGISTHNGTIDYTIDLLDNINTNNYIHCQITKDKNDTLYFWVNNEYIGNITPRNYNENPYFYVQTLDNNDKSIKIANLKIYHFIG